MTGEGVRWMSPSEIALESSVRKGYCGLMSRQSFSSFRRMKDSGRGCNTLVQFIRVRSSLTLPSRRTGFCTLQQALANIDGWQQWRRPIRKRRRIGTPPEGSHIVAVEVWELLVHAPAAKEFMHRWHVDGRRGGRLV